MEHEAGVEPACFGFKAQRGCRQPTTRVWIRRQESDLRGLRSERSWDASNPHLNDLAGRQGIEPCRPVLETSLLPEDNPNWRRAVSPSHMPRAARSAFQTAPGPRRVHSPNWRKAVGLDPHIPRGCHSLSRRGCYLSTSPSKLAEAERVERSQPSRIIVGFKPTKHGTCEPLDWRRADHSKAMPQDGTHRLATACRTPPASLSRIGARPRTCTSPLPLTRRAHRFLCVTGNWWAAQESHLDHSA
jgi:hypothetical protein